MKSLQRKGEPDAFYVRRLAKLRKETEKQHMKSIPERLQEYERKKRDFREKVLDFRSEVSYGGHLTNEERQRRAKKLEKEKLALKRKKQIIEQDRVIGYGGVESFLCASCIVFTPKVYDNKYCDACYFGK